MTGFAPIDLTPVFGLKVKGELSYRLPFVEPLTDYFEQAAECIDRLCIDVSSDVIGDIRFVCCSAAYSPGGATLIFKPAEPGPDALIFNVREVHANVDRGG